MTVFYLQCSFKQTRCGTTNCYTDARTGALGGKNGKKKFIFLYISFY